jgi:prepilin peptidase CpaA
MMEWMYHYGIVIILLVFAAFVDVKTRKIPNLITIPLIFFGVVSSLIQSSFWGLAFSFAGIILAFLIFLIPYAMGTLGAGDVKLMMGIGACIGPSMTLWSSVFVMIAGGVIAFFSLMIKVHPFYPIQLVKGFIFAIIYKDIKGFINSLKENSVDSIPYGVPILVGTVAAFCLL